MGRPLPAWLLEGVFIFPERIVTHPLVPVVCSIRVSSDVANANCAAGCPPNWVASPPCPAFPVPSSAPAETAPLP